jgi:hypothetical protein
MKKVLSIALIGLIFFSTLSILGIRPVSAATNDYVVFSQFDPGVGPIWACGGYVEYYGVPAWGDEIQYVYFMTGTTGYKYRVWVTNEGSPADPTLYIDIRQHPSSPYPSHVGPVEPRHFEYVSSKNLAPHSANLDVEEFYIDSSGVYLGPNVGIYKWDHDWNYIGQIGPAFGGGFSCQSLAYNPKDNTWYTGTYDRKIYQLSDTNSDGDLMDETWQYIFTYPDYGGSHHDGMEYVGGYLWLSDMTIAVIGKWQYSAGTHTWTEVGRYTYPYVNYVEGMGFGPNDHFWMTSGFPGGGGTIFYEVGDEITMYYPIADAGPDVQAYPPTIPLKFDGSGSHHTDPNRKIVLYQWDFDGDGVYDYSSTSPVAEHTYPAYYNLDGSIDWSITVKTYAVYLKVTDDDPVTPKTDVDTCNVHVTAPPWKPVADPDGPYEGYKGVPLKLDGSKSYDPESKMFPPSHPWYETIAKYEWDLDNDGQFDDASGANPTYTWNSEGLFTIALKVTDSQPSGAGGTFGPLDSDSKYTTVVVKSLERPDLTVKDVRPVQVVWHSDVNHDGLTDLVARKMTAVLATIVLVGKLEDDQSVEVKMTCDGHEYTQSYTVAQLLQNNGHVEFYFDAPESKGDYTINLDVDPQNQIIESNEGNNRQSVDITVKDSNSLYLTYFPVYATRQLPLGADPPWGYGALNLGEYSTMVENSGKFISGTYPVSEEEFTNRRIDLPYFGNTLPIIGMEQDAIELWALGELATLGATDRVVGVVPDDYFSYHLKAGVVGISFPGIQAVLCSKEDWSSPSHEIGHTYGLNLPKWRWWPPGWESTEEYDVNPPGNDANGFCVALHSEVTDATCLMGSLVPFGSFEDDYSRIWVCDDTYESLFKSFLVQKDDPQVLLVDGMIFKNGTVQLGTWYCLSEGESDDVTPGEYSVRLLDADRQVLGEVQFDAPFYVMANSGGVIETDVAGFAFTIPFYERTSTIQILRSGEVIAQKVVTPNPPSVRILYPNGGEILGGCGIQTISWKASDPDGDRLTYSVMYSKDGGSNWEPLAVDLKAQSFTWNTNSLPTGSNYLIRVIASDGVNTAMDDSDNPFTILAGWTHIFRDSTRKTELRININDRTFQFVAPDKDFGVKHDAKMIQLKQVIIICYEDKEMRLTATAVDDRTCVAIACDKQTGKSYWLMEHPATYTLTVYCKDANGKAVSGASVYVNGCYKGQTDSNGKLIIHDVLAATYTVTAKKCGYKDSSGTITVTGNATLTLTLTPQTYALTVRCKDSKGKAVSGASVSINGNYQGATDSNGKLSIINITAGTYTVTVQKSGYKNISVTVTINSDKTITITMT